MRGEVDHHAVGGRGDDLQQLLADHVGGPSREPHQDVLAHVLAGALGAADRDEAMPVRVIPDANVAGVELHLPFPVVDHKRPLVDAPVGRPHQPGVLLVDLVEPVALERVYRGLRGGYGPHPIAEGHLVEDPVHGVEEPAGGDVVLLGGLDLLDHGEPVDAEQPVERGAVDVGRQRGPGLLRQLAQPGVVLDGPARGPAQALRHIPG